MCCTQRDLQKLLIWWWRAARPALVAVRHNVLFCRIYLERFFCNILSVQKFESSSVCATPNNGTNYFMAHEKITASCLVRQFFSPCAIIYDYLRMWTNQNETANSGLQASSCNFEGMLKKTVDTKQGFADNEGVKWFCSTENHLKMVSYEQNFRTQFHYHHTLYLYSTWLHSFEQSFTWNIRRNFSS